MWWLWPHFKRIWAAAGAIAVGLAVNYLYGLMGNQSVPDLERFSHFLLGYWPWAGGVIVLFAVVSIIAEQAHRRHAAPHFIGETRGRKGAKLPPLPAATPSASTLIVGREGELKELRDWYASVLQGERRVVFVSGEAGIGKTTFVNTFIDSLTSGARLARSEQASLRAAARNTDRGVRIARGQCVEQYGAGEPYMPMLEALTQLGRGAEGQQLLAILHRLAPAWLAQLPALLTAEERVRIQSETQGLTQQRMLREMAQALAALAAGAPLVILLEDLHWSDASTLDLIAALARRTEPARLLILATYRPVEMLTGDHPLRALKEELEVHQQCQEVRLKLLSEGDVASYLARRFGDGNGSGIPRAAATRGNDRKVMIRESDLSFPRAPTSSAPNKQSDRINHSVAREIPESFAQIAPLIYARTDGNALFMVNVVDYLVAQGASLDASKIETPRNIRQMIERNLRRLDADEQAMLEAASVCGAEFSAAAVAAALERPVGEIETCCTRLARNEQFIRPQGESRWPDGTVASNVRFVHALYREVLYDRVPPGHRVELHRRIAEREEAAYGDQAGEIAAELADHYSRANDNNKAVKYFQLAGDRAVGRSAMVEAARHYVRALESLGALPADAERDRRELKLQLAHGPALIAAKGLATPETEHAYTRALELCERLGDSAKLFATLYGLWLMRHAHGELRTADELAEQLLRRAQDADDPALLVSAYNASGVNSYFMGNFLLAKEQLEMATALYNRERDQPLILRNDGGADAGVVTLVFAALTLWQLGYPDEALKRSDEACTLAQSLFHPFSLAFAESTVGVLRRYRRETAAVQENAETVIALCAEHGIADHSVFATILRGWAIAKQGQHEAGTAQIQEGMAALSATGAELVRPYYLCLLAEAYIEANRLDDALSALSEALASTDKNEERESGAEIPRLKGELLLKQNDSNAVEAQRCFERAIEVARKQSAKSFELRATTSLARLLASQGNRDEARTMLATIYNWFTEGFDTADLKDAKALLDRLDSGS